MRLIILSGLIILAFNFMDWAFGAEQSQAPAQTWWDKYFWHGMLILGMYGCLRLVQKMKQCHDCWPEYLGPVRICKIKTSKDGKRTYRKMLVRWLDLTAFIGTFGVAWYCLKQIVANNDGLSGPIRSNVHTPEQIVVAAIIIAAGQFFLVKGLFYLIRKFASEETANAITDGIYLSKEDKDDNPTVYAFKKTAQTLILGGGDDTRNEKTRPPSIEPDEYMQDEPTRRMRPEEIANITGQHPQDPDKTPTPK